MKKNSITLGSFFSALAALSLILSSCTPEPTPTSPPTPVSSTVSSNTLTPLPPASPTATFTPTAGIGSNWTRLADGMAMVYVLEGNFSMGGPLTDDQKPSHTVYLDAFWIDQTEVTNAMYTQCVQAGACQPPSLTSSSTHDNYYHDSQYANYPVIWVDWMKAQAYCNWAGVRLPTEAEWEKAARGTSGKPYPWGYSLPSSDRLNFNSSVGDTTAVGSYPSGASPYGALDMAGNVYEWTSDWYGDTYYANSPASNPQGPASGLYRVRRGGGWDSYDSLVRTTFRINSKPVVALNDIGFRCARSASAPYTYVAPTIAPTSTPSKPDLADFFARCPTADEIADVNARLKITFEGDPTADTLACTAAAGSADLTPIQKKAYQTIIIMKYLQFDEPLPWTDKQLYDWFTSSIEGIRFIYTPYKHNYDPSNPPPPSFCCDPAHVIDIKYSEINFLMTKEVWTNGEMGAGLADITGLLIHEARHNEFGAHTCGDIDKTPAEMGASGVQYYFFMWLAYHSDPDFLRAPGDIIDPTTGRVTQPDMYLKSALYNANSIWNSAFCNEPTQTPGPLILKP